MSTTAADLYKSLGFVVTTGTVKSLDNSGDECQYCCDGGAYVEAQIYYTIEGERVMEDGCGGCMFGRMVEINQLGVDTFHVETEEK